MKKLLIITFLAFITSACVFDKGKKQAEKDGKIVLLKPTEFKNKKENYLLIDVRTPAEFAQGHLQGAVNINYLDKSFFKKMKDINKSKPIFIYCKTGNRSGSASYQLIKKGFTKVYDLDGGIISWNKEKNKIVKP